MVYINTLLFPYFTDNNGKTFVVLVNVKESSEKKLQQKEKKEPKVAIREAAIAR